ncbi:MAG: BMP family ABC transporter substrate-binding protein [Desulfobacteraceae bacterium]|nr:BMP family ABC transporter substrate-binding protein [Desulfobacteraceae bacterium]
MNKITTSIYIIFFVFFSSASTLADKRHIKIGFIYTGPVSDIGWTYSHEQSRIKLMKQYPDVETFAEKLIPPGKTEAVIEKMISKGVTAVFATSLDYANPVKNMAQKYPGVHFFHCSGTERPSENVTTYFGRMHQPLYLAGALASLMSKTRTIGFLGSKKVPVTKRYANAFVMGAKKTNPDIRIKILWVEEWYNPEKATELTIDMVRDGADVFLNGQDSADPMRIALDNHVFAIGLNSDLSKFAPKNILTSAIWDWSVFYDIIIPHLKHGTWTGKDLWWGMEKKAVQLSPLSSFIPGNVASHIKKSETDLMQGRFHVFAGPVYDDKGRLRIAKGKFPTDNELLKMDWTVQY